MHEDKLTFVERTLSWDFPCPNCLTVCFDSISFNIKGFCVSLCLWCLLLMPLQSNTRIQQPAGRKGKTPVLNEDNENCFKCNIVKYKSGLREAGGKYL